MVQFESEGAQKSQHASKNKFDDPKRPAGGGKREGNVAVEVAFD